MKRSYVNSILRDADAFIRSFGYVLPPFAYFTPEQMARAGGQYRERGLGWDITDYWGYFCSPPAMGGWGICARDAGCSTRRRS